MAKKAPILKIKVMVASTIFGYEDQLEQICATLQGYKYEVWNSHMKTIPVHPGLSNTDNCLRAVESCDVFLASFVPDMVRFQAENYPLHLKKCSVPFN